MPEDNPINGRAMYCRRTAAIARTAFLVALSLLAPAALLSGGCAGSKTNDSVELPLPPKRLTFESYSFVPPAEKGWFIAERGPDYAVLAKTGTYIGQTLTMQSTRVALPAAPATLILVNHVRSTDAEGLLPPRFSIRLHDVVPASLGGANCVMSQIEVEDREPPSTSGPIVAQLVQTLSVICRDPARPDQGVKLSFTQRAYPEDRDRSFRLRGEPVMNSLQLSTPAQR